MKKTHLRPTLLISCFFALSLGFQTHAKSVLVKAEAESGYQTPIQSNSQQTYIFYPGFFKEGRSNTIYGKSEFDKVCARLESVLSTQNFQRVDADAENPDLVILVNWGETTVNREDTSLYPQTGNPESRVGASIPHKSNRQLNAQLIGTEDQLANERHYSINSFVKNDRAKYATATDRYFFILKAYQFTSLANKDSTPLWVTRFSTESKWNKYENALEDMCTIASRYVGKESNGITFENL